VSRFPDDALSIVSASRRVAAGNTVQTCSLPTTQDGKTATCILMQTTGTVYFLFGQTSTPGVTTATGTMLSQYAPLLLKVQGLSFLGFLTDVSTSVYVSAVEVG
jgi:hypothetical protein